MTELCYTGTKAGAQARKTKGGGRIFAEIVEKIISVAAESGRRITKRDFARNMQISDANFGNKFRRNTFSVLESVKSLDALGFDVIVRDRSNFDEYNMLTGEYFEGNPKTGRVKQKSDVLFDFAEKLGFSVVLKGRDGSEITVNPDDFRTE